MIASVLVLTLLTLAASLASWLFGQWLARRTVASLFPLRPGDDRPLVASIFTIRDVAGARRQIR